LFNGLMDARKEGAPIIAIAGDVESSIIDTSALEELNPYKFFEAASLYTARLVNPEQARAVITTAIVTAVVERGPTVLAIPGDIAAADAPDQPTDFTIAGPAILRPSDTDFEKLVRMIDKAKTVAIFGGDGCHHGKPGAQLGRECWIVQRDLDGNTLHDFVKLPVALSGGNKANCDPLAGAISIILPRMTCPGYSSIRSSACPQSSRWSTVSRDS
jgi:hypothetical protein